MMDAVYSKRTRVIVWLGEERNTGCTLVKWLLQLAEFRDVMLSRHPFKTLKFENKLLGVTLPLFLYITNDHLLTDLDSSVLRELAAAVLKHQDWPFRIWTIQEIALASTHSNIVVCGNSIIPWLYLNVLVSYKHPLSALTRATSRCSQLRRELADNERLSQGISFMELSHTLEDLHSRATDARDHVYGLYAIFLRLNLNPPEPDYNKTVPRTFEDMTVAVIKVTGDLEVLQNTAHNGGNTSELPSWVVDWRFQRFERRYFLHCSSFGRLDRVCLQQHSAKD
jgi:hypothetical protein